MNIEIGNRFTVKKTSPPSDIFVEVIFRYPEGEVWEGCFPLHYSPMSLRFDIKVIDPLLSVAYNQMKPGSIGGYIDKTKNLWLRDTKSETYNVFKGLLSGKWECRSCRKGKKNNQQSARIRDIKKKGFVVATQIRMCATCKKKQYHDILLVFDIESKTKTKPEFRKPISALMEKKIKKTLGCKDVFFDRVMNYGELHMDHKFPSQRWTKPETDNGSLTESEIKNKFQLLTHQSNMLKSRLCDECCETGIRPGFLGIKWFYSGDENWVKNDKDGSGCNGCPWFDLAEWKNKINIELKKK